MTKPGEKGLTQNSRILESDKKDKKHAEFIVRTGADQPWEPEDLAVAQGKDPTPKNVEHARRQLEKEGPAAIEKTVP